MYVEIIKRYEDETEVGIVIPNMEIGTVWETPTRGRVLAIGPKVRDIKPGMIINFLRYAGVKVDEEHCIVCEADAFVVEDDLYSEQEVFEGK